MENIKENIPVSDELLDQVSGGAAVATVVSGQFLCPICKKTRPSGSKVKYKNVEMCLFCKNDQETIKVI